MKNKKVTEWAPVIGGAVVALVIFTGLFRAGDVDDAESYPASRRVPKGYERMEDDRSFSSLVSSSLPSAPFSSSAVSASSSITNTEGLPHEYKLGRRPSRDWDAERKIWLSNHSQRNHADSSSPRLFMLTGSQPEPCPAEQGDHLLLKSFKNKVDYCMLHGVQMYYNTAILDENMDGFWSKLPLIRAAMEAHPEADWFWWVDSDLVITDMAFEIPLHEYGDYNLVVHGWESEVFEKKSVLGLNAGSFLLRNCAWSFRFMDRWASMGPKGRIRTLSGRIQSAFLTDRSPNDPGDDQSALVYFMIKERRTWGDKILLERRYNLNGYWLDLVGELLDNRTTAPPFVTHFSGCQPCSGNHNPNYGKQQCRNAMELALNFADNQVLKSLGFRHCTLNSLNVEPLISV